LSDKHKKGDLAPFAEPVYCKVNTDSEEPYARLVCRHDDGNIVMDVFNKNGAYVLKLFSRDSEQELPAKLKEELMGQRAFQAKEDGRISLTVDREKIEAEIDEVVRIVRTFANRPTP
jgi:hypothetical protein